MVFSEGALSSFSLSSRNLSATKGKPSVLPTAKAQATVNMASYHLSVKVGVKGKALPHADYIARQGEYKTRQGEKLEATAYGNLPDWAQDNPSLFWQCSDQYERQNGSSYREIEIALPRELSPEQRKDLVKDFVEQELGQRHAYSWAIHTPKASIEGGEQPHAHIMYSERIQDGIERGPDQFFKRYNAKHPERGGCQKSNIAKSVAQRKQELVALRQRFATLQNHYLEKYQHADRVDHRSHADRGLTQTPERHLGWQQAQRPMVREKILEYRQAIQDEQRYRHALPQHLDKLDQAEQTQHAYIEQGVAQAKVTLSDYEKLIEQHRKDYIYQQVQAELKQYQQQAKGIRQQIEQLDQNKPLLLGKKDWESKRHTLVEKHQQIIQQHNEVKANKEKELKDDLCFGREQAIAHIQKEQPKLLEKVEKAKTVIAAVQQLERQERERQRVQQLEKTQVRSKGRSR